MTDSCEGSSSSEHAAARRLAQDEIRRAAHVIARQMGGCLAGQPPFRERFGLASAITDVEPLLGVLITSELGKAARRRERSYITQAREDGRTWEQIGNVLGLPAPPSPGAAPAEAAYNYAAGDAAGIGRRSFAWVCPACMRTVLDRGPDAGHPADCEEGHAEDCARLAAAVRRWAAQWGEEDGR